MLSRQPCKADAKCQSLCQDQGPGGESVRAHPGHVAPSLLCLVFSTFPPILLTRILCLAYRLSCMSDLRPRPLPPCIPSLAPLPCLWEPAAPLTPPVIR